MTNALLKPELVARWQDPTGKFARLLVPVLTTQQVHLVRADIVGDKKPCLEILLEPLDAEPLTLDRCAAVSKLISATLDVADPIADKYTLDVGTAGGERPLTQEADFERFKGFTVKIKRTTKDDDGRAKLKGALEGLTPEGIKLADGTVITADDVREIRLVADDYYFERVKKGTFPKPFSNQAGEKP